MTDQEQRERQAVIAEARTWLKTPYHHGARVKGAGVDCALLLAEVYAAAGLIPQIDPGYYSPDWHLHQEEERYLAWIQKYAYQVESPLLADVAMCQGLKSRTYNHSAIVIAWPHQVIHALIRERGVVLGDVEHTEFAGRPVRFYRLHGWGQ